MSNGNNIVKALGYIEKDFRKSYEYRGRRFYESVLVIPRKSGTKDEIVLVVEERVVRETDPKGAVFVQGQFRSINVREGDKNRLKLYLYASSIEKQYGCMVAESHAVYGGEENAYPDNYIFLDGYVCKNPVYRVTPLGREITDVIVAVNRHEKNSDYIPCIAWGKVASKMKSLAVGTRVLLKGRVQSRKYEKLMDDGSIQGKTAYEVSISSMETVKA